MLVMLALVREPLPTIQHFQWLSWMGGIFGAIYIAISICCFRDSGPPRTRRGVRLESVT